MLRIGPRSTARSSASSPSRASAEAIAFGEPRRRARRRGGPPPRHRRLVPARHAALDDALRRRGHRPRPGAGGPLGRARPRAAALIHGGFWRDRYDRTLMDALAADLAARGWRVEHRVPAARQRRRRAGDARDVAAAIDSLPTRALLERVVAIGHSAGGHLAPGRPRAEAPCVTHRGRRRRGVLDLAEAARLASRRRRVEFLGGHTRALRAASPIERLPLGVPQLLVHGGPTTSSRLAMSRAFAEAAGGDAESSCPPGTSAHRPGSTSHPALRRA